MSAEQRIVERAVPFSKSLAVIGLVSALYIVSGGLLGIVVGPFLRGYPAHFMRGWLMSAVAAYSRRMWSASLMGLISGLLFLVIVPAPAPYLPLASFMAGVVYDLVCSLGGGYGVNARAWRRIIPAIALSGFAESVVALAVLTFMGIIEAGAFVLAIIWAVAISANILLSILGSLVTVWMIRRGIGI